MSAPGLRKCPVPRCPSPHELITLVAGLPQEALLCLTHRELWLRSPEAHRAAHALMDFVARIAVDGENPPLPDLAPEMAGERSASSPELAARLARVERERDELLDQVEALTGSNAGLAAENHALRISGHKLEAELKHAKARAE